MPHRNLAIVIPRVYLASNLIVRHRLFCHVRPTVAASAPRATRGQLQMAKHVMWKGAKKAAKKRPKKHRLSDIHRKAPEYSVEITSNGNFEGAPPAFEVVESS
ncbi:unnamed protein product [Phaeothamnion confervicola]